MAGYRDAGDNADSCSFQRRPGQPNDRKETRYLPS